MYAASQNLLFFECSARTGVNVNEIFVLIAEKLVQHDAAVYTAQAGERGWISAPIMSWNTNQIVNLRETRQSSSIDWDTNEIINLEENRRNEAVQRGYCC